MAISMLRALYCYYGLRVQPHRLSCLFTPQCLFEIPGGDGGRIAVRTREGIAELLGRSSAPPGAILPLIHNEETYVDGETARGMCVLHRPGTAVAPEMAARYIEGFARVDGRWLFSERRLYRMFPHWEDGPDAATGRVKQ